MFTCLTTQLFKSRTSPDFPITGAQLVRSTLRQANPPGLYRLERLEDGREGGEGGPEGREGREGRETRHEDLETVWISSRFGCYSRSACCRQSRCISSGWPADRTRRPPVVHHGERPEDDRPAQDPESGGGAQGPGDHLQELLGLADRLPVHRVHVQQRGQVHHRLHPVPDVGADHQLAHGEQSAEQPAPGALPTVQAPSLPTRSELSAVWFDKAGGRPLAWPVD